jgi:hypothetical protein
MIVFLNVIIVLLTALLTLSILPHFSIFFTVPLVPLFFLIPLVYFRKGIEPFLIAAGAGIIFDFFSGYPFGFYLGFFLLVSLIIRILFQEGMRSFTFLHYLILLSVSLVTFYLFQIIYLVSVGAPFAIMSLGVILAGLAVNIFCGILFYAFNNWYFDKTREIGNYLKRR